MNQKKIDEKIEALAQKGIKAEFKDGKLSCQHRGVDSFRYQISFSVYKWDGLKSEEEVIRTMEIAERDIAYDFTMMFLEVSQQQTQLCNG